MKLHEIAVSGIAGVLLRKALLQGVLLHSVLPRRLLPYKEFSLESMVLESTAGSYVRERAVAQGIVAES